MRQELGRLLRTPSAVARRLAGRPVPLRGKRILVTGASSGIGEATALALGREGAHVLLVARREERLHRVAEEVRRAGGTASCHVCDLTDDAAVDRLVEEVLAEHGAVDMLVNNAGRSIRRSVSLSYDRMHDVERTMRINFLAPVRLTLGLLPAMVAQGDGHVVNVLSWGVQVKAPKFSAYLASKSALDVWSRIVGRELYADGVTFTNIRMPLVRTPMIGSTDVYRRAPALTPEQAAARVVRALQDRPLTVDTAVGRVSEVLNLVVPRLSDAVAHHASARFPDSPAARGAATPHPATARTGAVPRI